MTWFEGLFGFLEGPYFETQKRFLIEGEQLTSAVNGRSFGAGRFSTPSVAALRDRAAGQGMGALTVEHVAVNDILSVHADRGSSGALFQAASQLNCLEFAGPGEIPEHGVTQYAGDPTQGPACALACAAGTVLRNYFADVDGQQGQTADRQINNLDDVQAALGDAGSCVTVRNGYTFSDAARLSRLNAAIALSDRDDLIRLLKVGLHQNVQVTFADRFVEPDHTQYVCQVYCSAVSCSYSAGGLDNWSPLARLVLDGAYEATLLAAVLDQAEGSGSGEVWLTFLGGGAFHNRDAWIADAIGRALARMHDRALTVRLAHFRRIDRDMVTAITRAQARHQ